jgi:hypothetical protein
LLRAHALRSLSKQILWAASPFSELSKSSLNVVNDWLSVRRSPPQSAHIFNYLKPLLSEFTATEEDLNLAFDKLEYLISLVYADFQISCEQMTGNELLLYAPPGLFVHNRQYGLGDDKSVIQLTDSEIDQQRGEWFPLSSGLFGGSIDRLNAAVRYAKKFFASQGIA